jgi:hypothetical protein
VSFYVRYFAAVVAIGLVVGIVFLGLSWWKDA